MAAGGRVAPRRAVDGFERPCSALDSARRALAKASAFGVESVVGERTVPLDGLSGAKKKASNAFDTSDVQHVDVVQREERREVRRLARVFARADRVFASWSL